MKAVVGSFMTNDSVVRQWRVTNAGKNDFFFFQAGKYLIIPPACMPELYYILKSFAHTFYRFPQQKFLENWYAVSPGDFRFSVKAPRLITHYKQFTDCDQLLTDFYDTTLKGLKDKLGAILFQLPPSFSYNPELIHTQNSGYLEEGKSYNTKTVIGFLNDWSPKALDPKQYMEQ